MSKSSEAQAMRRGLMRAYIASAKRCLMDASGFWDLLSEEERQAMDQSVNLLTALDQSVWKDP